MLSLDKQEDYRRRYAATCAGWRPSTQVFEDAVAARLTPSSRVLDLGCGRGGIVERLGNRPAHLTGIDLDLSSLRQHRLDAGWAACSRAEALPFPDRAFDVACCSWVLEHLADPASAFAEISRVLRPSGHLVLLTPNVRHPLMGVNRLLGWTKGGLVRRLYGRGEGDTFPALYRANSVGRIDRFARAAGLDRVSLSMVGDPSYLAFGEVLFRLACLAERLTPSALRVHIVAGYVAR